MVARAGQLLERLPTTQAPLPAPCWHPTACGEIVPGVVIAHGAPRRVSAVSRIRDFGGTELVRIDLETGEQLHRYASDMVVVYLAHAASLDPVAAGTF